jgi:hypothetical protein
VFGVAVCSVLIAIGVYIAALLDRSPPVAYTESVYLPTQSIVCPGDTLVFTPTLTIHPPAGTPVVRLLVVRTWWSDDTRTTPRLADGTVVPDVITYRNVLPGRYAVPVRFVVPAFSYGRYRMLVTTSDATSTTAGYAVPFTVRPCR